MINANSMQVYRDLRIITARPTPDEEARAPHRLYGHVDAAVNHSVGHWFRDAQVLLTEAAASGQTPIFVGGTGLYFKALSTGLAAIPAIDPDIRARWHHGWRARASKSCMPSSPASIRRPRRG